MKDHKTEENEGVIWENFRKRAEVLRNSARSIRLISDDQKEAIFQARADSLRLEKGKVCEDKDLLKLISFYVAGEFFGIEVKYLQEVYEVAQVTKIPCTPAVLTGLINYRGTVLTIINLSALFELQCDAGTGKGPVRENPYRPYADVSKKILIVKYKGAKAGIIIERLDNLLELRKTSVRPVSSFFHNKNRIITSEIKMNHLPLLIIDPEALLNDERLIVNEDVC